MTGGADADTQTAPARQVLVELVSLHAQAMRRMPWVQALLVAGIGVMIHAFVGAAMFIGWGALTIGVEGIRAGYSASVLQRASAVAAGRVHGTFIALAAVSGAAIGFGAALFMPQLPLLDQAALGIVLFAIPAAGVAVSQSSRYIVAAYAASILFPAAGSWALLHGSQAAGVIGLTLLYCAVIVMAAADGEKLLLRSVTIRHQRDRLVRDLERKNAEVRGAVAEAEHAAQARSRVLAAASHDLRQPLHALSVYSAVLASRPAPELLDEVSGNIDQIVRALGNLLNGLLDLSRLSGGYYVPEHQNVALDRVISGVCAEYQQAAAHKSLALIQDLRPARILGDPVAIGRIARNLIENAIKYTEEGSVRVSLHTERLGRAPLVVLSVADTGKGIAAAEQDRIFEEFYQLDNPGRDRNRGVGLGLAIVQRLCELIGAKIALESRVDQGSCFRVTMPALAADPTLPEIPHREAAGIAPTGKRVFVIDDEVDILKSMRALLEVWGLATSTARSAAEADRLIVDLRLGDGVHGARLADRARAQYGNFPVLIITGETASEALRDANEAGYELLQKPIAPEVLRRAIAAGLSPGGGSGSTTMPAGNPAVHNAAVHNSRPDLGRSRKAAITTARRESP